MKMRIEVLEDDVAEYANLHREYLHLSQNNENIPNNVKPAKGTLNNYIAHLYDKLPNTVIADLSCLELNNEDLRYVKLNGSKLYATQFGNADLSFADFENTELYLTNFFKANLQNANFNNIKAKEVSFFQADLRNASFLKASFKMTNFGFASFEQTNFAEAQLFYTRLTEEQLQELTFSNSNEGWVGKLVQSRKIDNENHHII